MVISKEQNVQHAGFMKLAEKWLRSHWPYVLLLLLPAGIFAGTLTQRGYILQYDMVFVPHPHVNWPAYHSGQVLYSSLPVTYLLTGLAHLVPLDIVQKLILAALFYGAAAAVYITVPARTKTARLIAAVAYAANPFTYDRLMAGHWLFLAGYALLPLVARAFYRALTTESRRNWLLAILLWTAATLFSPHFLVLLAVLFAAMCLVAVRSRKQLMTAAFIVGGTAVLNGWWLLPLFISHNLTQTFTVRELYAFASRPDPDYGLWFNLLSMQGFWYGGWKAWSEYVPLWPVVATLWLAAAGFGLGTLARTKRPQGRFLAGLVLAGGIGLLYAAGPSSFVGPLNTWIFSHVPGMIGLREPQKLLSLYILAVVTLGAIGIDFLLQHHKRLGRVSAVVIAVLVTAMGWPLVGAAHGQMHTTTYGEGWRQLDARLQAAGPGAKAVVLPWGIYINKSFTGRLVANPAQAYYGERAIFSWRAGVPGVADYPEAAVLPLQRAIDAGNAEEVSRTAKNLGASYVLLVHSDDDRSYDWLRAAPSLRLIHSDAQMAIFSIDKADKHNR